MKDTRNPYYVDTSAIVRRIQEGKSKPTIDRLRSEADDRIQKEIKELLPAVCFSGTFTTRKNESLMVHSGLVAVDFDHLNGDLSSFRKKVESDRFTHICFLSPRGNGLKVVVRIPASRDTHRGSCAALLKYYHDERMDDFRDVSRICFESYDPNIYYNPSSALFEEVFVEPKVTVSEIHYSQIETDFDEIYANLKRWMDKKGEQYRDGNKHLFLFKLACAANRFGIPQSITTQKLLGDFLTAAGRVTPDEFEGIVLDSYKRYHAEHNTAFFDKTEVMRLATRDDEPPLLDQTVLDVALPAKDVIYLRNVKDKILEHWKNGTSKGDTTHYKTLDDRFRWKRKEVTLWGGHMNHGKSTKLMQLCLIRSLKEGLKWGVFGPENYPPEDFYMDLMHMMAGQTVDPRYRNQMSEETLHRTEDFINNHFFYVYPENDSPTPEYINERFLELIIKHQIDGCITDPFNQLDNDIKAKGSIDLYVSSFLSKELRFASDHNVYKVIVAHPNSSIDKYKSGEFAGNYAAPDQGNFSGGVIWSQKVHNVVVIHRPFFDTQPDNPRVDFIRVKSKKPRLTGVRGTTSFNFDVATCRYLEEDHTTPYPAITALTKIEEAGEVVTPSRYANQFWQQQLNGFDKGDDEHEHSGYLF